MVERRFSFFEYVSELKCIYLFFFGVRICIYDLAIYYKTHNNNKGKCSLYG